MMKSVGQSRLGMALAAILGLSFFAQPLSAQVLYGSIVGNVSDPTSAAISGARVVITNLATNPTRETITNSVGLYNFATVPAGTYRVEVTQQGFRSAQRTDVNVSTNTVTRVNFTLELGAVTESVTVSGAVLALQTDRSEVRSEIVEKVLEELPVPPGRNYQQLFNTVPGFTTPRNAHSVPSNPSRSLQYEVNGVAAASNNIRLDGATQFNVWLPHITAYVPALESIQAVDIVTNSFDAEQGLAGGAAINVSIKSGTNDLHGSAFWYHNNNNTKARPFFLPANQDRPKLVYNQFGGTVGGPIVRDKVFYFASYEGTYDREFAGALSSAPTAAMRRGDMSASSRLIYDPLTGTPDGKGRLPFAGNMVPADRLDPIALKIVDFMPALTYPDQISANYYSQGAYRFDRNTLDTKQLERHGQGVDVPALQLPGLRDGRGDAVGERTAGLGDRRGEPGRRLRQHLQRHGGYDLRADAVAGIRHELRLHADGHERGAVPDRGEHRAGRARHSGHERLTRLRRGLAGV
jgi:hypothetical protein